MGGNAHLQLLPPEFLEAHVPCEVVGPLPVVSVACEGPQRALVPMVAAHHLLPGSCGRPTTATAAVPALLLLPQLLLLLLMLWQCLLCPAQVATTGLHTLS